jgi:glycerophosphoryl diester phosphodiesterase
MLVIAHREASAYEPENSIAAFRAAVALGADGVELDVHDTADGVLVVHHDQLLGGRRMRNLTLAEVRAHQLPNGEPIPTLGEALDALGPDMLVFIEVKTLDAANDEQLLQAIDAGPAPDHCHVHSFDHRIIKRLHDARPSLVGGILSSSYPLEPLRPITAAGASELWQDQSLIDRQLVTAVHEAGAGAGAGAKIYAWTVDDPVRMRELVAMEVDGICSNKPDVVREVLA